MGNEKEKSNNKKYGRGYVMGVFDLFHVGHLNLLEKAKARCEHLTVGVLTDELVVSQKKIRPFVPYEERARLIAALRCVDEVVPVDDPMLSKVSEWERHHFDCLFSGNDYEGNPLWEAERARLRELGAEIEFFPYTQSTSSTMIRKAIASRIGNTDDREA